MQHASILSHSCYPDNVPEFPGRKSLRYSERGMAPKQRTFSAKGSLRGMGREALYTVMGTRKTLPDNSAGELVRVSVYQEPADLPDRPIS